MCHISLNPIAPSYNMNSMVAEKGQTHFELRQEVQIDKTRAN